MRVVLEIVSGPNAGRKIEVQPGQAALVGRASFADLPVTNDTNLAGRHFTLECEETRCSLFDLGSRQGTMLNGGRVARAVLRDGDRIVAGQTNFSVRIEGAAIPSAEPEQAGATAVAVSPAALQTPQSPQDLLQYLRGQDQPLFALLDAAQEPKLVGLLDEHHVEHESLYEGQKAVEYQDYAPYLVRLPRDSSFLELIVERGWGHNWGAFLTSDQPFAAVRKHFRRFLMVELPDGKKVYFRFYDPRVLRVFLSTLNEKETAEFFGPIDTLLMEAEETKTLLKFRASQGRVRQETVAVSMESAMASGPV